MRVMKASALAIALAVCTVAAQDADKKVAGGGITAKGWMGKVDAAAAKKGMTVNDAKFMEMGGGFHITTGPATTYWNPTNTATGDYTVKASFAESKNKANHPHAYGVFIGGSKLDTETPSLVYCIAYGNGTYLVRGFSGGTVFTPVPRSPNDAVKKAGADGSVTQDIAFSVKGDTATCTINGAVVATVKKADLVGPGKLDSTDGVYGLRVGHNLDVMVTGLSKN